MNFKELIKIPVPPAPQTDIPAETTVYVKREYYGGGYDKTVKNFLYLAEIMDKMLVVTVYHGGEFMWRTFVTDTDYCTQKAGNPKKSTAGVWALIDYSQSYIPVDGAGETVKRYVDMFHKYDALPPGSYWHQLEQGLETVNSLQIRIRNKKTAERHRKIRESTEECMLEIRPPVKAFTEWLKHQSSSVYVIYHTGDDYGVCTHCLKKVERKKIKTEWKHRGNITCPHCHKKATLLCSGRFRDGRIECHHQLFWYVQKTREGCCVRLFEELYNLCKNTDYGYGKEQIVPITREWNKSTAYIEVCRIFLDRNGNVDKSFVWGNFMQTGENYWCRNYDTYYSARFYTGNLRQALSNYKQLAYMPWDKVSQIAGTVYLWNMIKTLVRRPWIEYLIKVGLKNLAYDYLKGSFDEVKASELINGMVSDKKSLAHILGLNRRELREIIPYDPDKKELKLYKILLHNRAGIKEWEYLRFAHNYSAIAEALEYQPASRYIRYTVEQAELYEQQDYGDWETVISDYADYLQEAKAAGYNMEDTATINPRSLIVAHSEAEVDKNIAQYRRDYSKYADELATAAENIAKVKGITYEDKQYHIAPVMSWEELINESKCLRHCVASYAKKYADGSCIIFGIRNVAAPDTPMYTLELTGDFKRIVQCRGFKNRSAPESVMEAVEKWHKNLLEKNTKKAG